MTEKDTTPQVSGERALNSAVRGGKERADVPSSTVGPAGDADGDWVWD